MSSLALVAVVLLAVHALTWRFLAGLPSSIPRQTQFSTAANFHIGLLLTLVGVFMLPGSGFTAITGAGALVLGAYLARQATLTRRALLLLPNKALEPTGADGTAAIGASHRHGDRGAGGSTPSR